MFSNKGKQIRSQSFNNNNSNRYAQTPQRYYVNRREMEIIGRIVNYRPKRRIIRKETLILGLKRDRCTLHLL